MVEHVSIQFFDETKEIAFIPLSQENQRKGKAIVDGLASRFGKSGGALIYIVLFMLCGDISNTIPYVFVIILFAIAFWVYSVYGLGRMINKQIEQEDIEHMHEDIDELLASENS